MSIRATITVDLWTLSRAVMACDIVARDPSVAAEARQSYAEAAKTLQDIEDRIFRGDIPQEFYQAAPQ